MRNSDFITTENEARTGNRRLLKVAVQISADTFVVNQSLVLNIKICNIERHLGQTVNRYAQYTGQISSIAIVDEEEILKDNDLSYNF